MDLLRSFLRSRVSLLLVVLALVAVGLTAPRTSDAISNCAGGLFGTETYYSDATYTTVVGTCRKTCCQASWYCFGNTHTAYRLEDVGICEVGPGPF